MSVRDRLDLARFESAPPTDGVHEGIVKVIGGGEDDNHRHCRGGTPAARTEKRQQGFPTECHQDEEKGQRHDVSPRGYRRRQRRADWREQASQQRNPGHRFGAAAVRRDHPENDGWNGGQEKEPGEPTGEQQVRVTANEQ